MYMIYADGSGKQLQEVNVVPPPFASPSREGGNCRAGVLVGCQVRVPLLGSLGRELALHLGHVKRMNGE